MEIVIDIPDDEVFNGYYTQKDGIREYHSMKSEYTVVQPKVECEDAVSRQAVIDCATLITSIPTEDWDIGDWVCLFRDRVSQLPSVQPKAKTGRWVEVAQYADGKHKIECSECGNHIFDRGHANSHNVKEKYKFCPSCGAKMVEPQESEV